MSTSSSYVLIPASETAINHAIDGLLIVSGIISMGIILILFCEFMRRRGL